MRKSLFVLVAALMVATTIPAFAELQNVQVGGQIRIRGNWYSEAGINLGLVGIPDGTWLTFVDDIPDTFFVEQRTKLNVKADFTDDVTAFIEVDAYNHFGDDFRGTTNVETAAGPSEAPLGIDSSDGTSVNLYQGYIEMRESWGYPLTFRIGRSEMQHGSEFLVGNNDTSSVFRGLSFDGVWATYEHDQFNAQAFWSRVVQNDPSISLEDDGQTDFAGLYASYTGIEDMSIDGFYYYYRQALTLQTLSAGFAESIQFHTFGLRFAGSKAQFDWDLNGAYQLGQSGVAAPLDDHGAFGIAANLGYTFDVEYQPRIFVQGAYYDRQDDEVWGFNRLFSDHEYSEFLDVTDLTNFWYVGGGASAQVTEAVNLAAVANYYSVVEDFGTPDEALGVELAVYMTYNYSEDLYFQLGYAHFFTMDGVQSGQLVTQNGFPTSLFGGFGALSDEDLNYVFFETGISF